MATLTAITTNVSYSGIRQLADGTRADRSTVFSRDVLPPMADGPATYARQFRRISAGAWAGEETSELLRS
jgi:hypothetical protein